MCTLVEGCNQPGEPSALRCIVTHAQQLTPVFHCPQRKATHQEVHSGSTAVARNIAGPPPEVRRNASKRAVTALRAVELSCSAGSTT
jgi:hypothetical protein